MPPARKKKAAATRRSPARKARPQRRRWLRLLPFVLGAWMFYEAGRFPAIDDVLSGDPGKTAFMHWREREARDTGATYRLRHTWVPLGQISPNLRNAVLVAEDDRFFAHDGFDFIEIRHAVEEHVRDGKKLRGASTISQQVTRNLWLSPDRSLARKLREAAYTFAMERRLDKERILELYLNIAEWGDGIFGAEAAARHYFGVGARQLSAEQAALLSAALPNPLERNPARPSARHRQWSRRIMARMARRPASREEPKRQAPGEPVVRKRKAKAGPKPAVKTAVAATPRPKPAKRAARDVLRPVPTATPTPAPTPASPPRDLLAGPAN